MNSWLANSLWIASGRAEARRFHHALHHVESTQTDLLRSYLKANADTDFGRRHDFARLTSVADYPKAVPLSTWDDYTASIAAIAAGQPAVLTAEAVRLFELSSGSTAAVKWIPYTAALKAEFQRGLAPWAVDLYGRYPDMLRGPAYWSLTPLTTGPRFTEGGIPLGFEEDSAYLGPLGKLLVESAFAVPNALKQIEDMAAFRYATLRFLLQRADLRFISIWNPTYLELLLAALPESWEQLLADIAAGTLTPPTPLPPALHRELTRRLRPDRRRTESLARLNPTAVDQLWPVLKVISGWADGPSAPYAQRLSARFPAVVYQPKGLLATEGFITLPLGPDPAAEGCILAVRSHFFEFQPVDAPEDPPRLAHQLEKGRSYSVIITTGGGFYRYQLHDIVAVVGYQEQAPRLRFIGKADRISDWFGEKLDERFIAGVIAQLAAGHNLTPRFAMLAPEESPGDFHYTLYLELPQEPASQNLNLKELEADLERGLCANFHYHYCRQLGQLGPARIRRTAPGATTAYLQACQARGQKLGNIKPAALQKTTGWEVWLLPQYESNLD